MKLKLIIIIIASIIISVVPSSHPAWKYGRWSLDLDADADTTMMASTDDILDPGDPWRPGHVIIIIEKQEGANE